MSILRTIFNEWSKDGNEWKEILKRIGRTALCIISSYFIIISIYYFFSIFTWKDPTLIFLINITVWRIALRRGKTRDHGTSGMWSSYSFTSTFSFRSSLISMFLYYLLTIINYYFSYLIYFIYLEYSSCLKITQWFMRYDRWITLWSSCSNYSPFCLCNLRSYWNCQVYLYLFTLLIL